MLSKQDAMRIFKDQGVSEEQTRKAFEEVDIDNDGELPRSGSLKLKFLLE